MRICREPADDCVKGASAGISRDAKFICPSTGKPSDCRARAGNDNFYAISRDPPSKPISFNEVDGSSYSSRELIFPSELISRKAHSLYLKDPQACSAFIEQLRWFVGRQIRNVASVGGNICTASPIFDLNHLGWHPAHNLTSLIAKEEFKQAHRRDDDISLVNAVKTAAFLKGKPWTPQTLQGALQTLQEEIIIAENAPGGMVIGEAEYADDTSMPPNGLHAALVLSKKPHARICFVDDSATKDIPGFEGFFLSAKDVPGGNDIGVVVNDEELFALEFVTCVGSGHWYCGR
eukprot:Gb_32558 [translate_table: standard]